jgi:alpha/beta superfamily hydrolase
MKHPVILHVAGNDIVGEFATPGGDSRQPFHTVCICHGVPSGSKPEPGDGGYPLLAEQLRASGFATFIFNFRGTGVSGGNFDILGWVKDLRAALDYLD